MAICDYCSGAPAKCNRLVHSSCSSARASDQPYCPQQMSVTSSREVEWRAERACTDREAKQQGPDGEGQSRQGRAFRLMRLGQEATDSRQGER